MTPAQVIQIAARAAEVDYDAIPDGVSVEACPVRYREGCRDDAHHLAVELLAMGWSVSIERGERDVVLIEDPRAGQEVGAA